MVQSQCQKRRDCWSTSCNYSVYMMATAHSSNYGLEIEKRCIPFRTESDLDPLIEQLKNKKVVMLGEASHGTQEFYEWRAAITRKLIEDHGFNFVAVEGDWPSCEELNQFVHNRRGENVHFTLKRFSRWPNWMWANTEVARFAEWLRGRNSSVGFHGLDLYSLFESVELTVNQLEKINSSLAYQARLHYGCFDPYLKNEKNYIRSLFRIPEGCKKEVAQMLQTILKTRIERSSKEIDAIFFDATQNARIVVNAEHYYHALLEADEQSWNIRDRHTFYTLWSKFKSHCLGTQYPHR